MASLPMDQTESTSRGSGKPPVSAHPAFPAIVALWFAALLGIGTLIVPVQLVEQVLSATGIASIFPSAAPPLGFTARAGIALIATLLGAVLGLVAARRVSARGAPSFTGSRKDSGMRALNPVEDLDDDFLGDDLPPFRETPTFSDAPPFSETRAPLGRRRPLAMAEHETRSDFLEVAPLPGETAGYDVDDDELELSDHYASDNDLDDSDGLPARSATDTHARQEFMPTGSIPQSIDELIVSEAEETQAEAPLEIEKVETAAPEHGNEAPHPLPFSPPSLARQSEADNKDADAPDVEEPTVDQAYQPALDDEPTHEVSVPDTSDFASTDFASTDSASTECGSADVTDLNAMAAYAEPSGEAVPANGAIGEEPVGLVQLVQKLGSTLEKHREWSAQRAAAAEAEALLEAQAEAGAGAEAAESGAPEPEPAAGEIAPEFDPAAPDDAAEAMAAYFGKPAAVEENSVPVEEKPANAVPAAGMGYQPFAGMGRLTVVDQDDQDDEDEHDDIAASFTLPVMGKPLGDAAEQAPSPRPSFDVPPADAPASSDAEVAPAEDNAASAAASDASYRSLSQMDNPFKRAPEEFVRVVEPEPEFGAAEPAVLFPNQQAHKSAAENSGQAPAEAGGARAFDPPSGLPPVAAPAAKEPRNPAAHEDNEQALRAALMNLQRMTK